MSPSRQAPDGLRLNLLLAALLAGLAVLSLGIGATPLPLLQTLVDAPSAHASSAALILLEVRLPRTLVALFTGATLGLCGAALQGLLHNPLASPGLVGSASGAALGAVTILYTGAGTLFPLALPLGGITGSLLATLLVYLLAGRDAGSVTLILAGVAVNTLAMALVSLILNLAPSPYAVQEIVLWMLGSLNNLGLPEFWIMLPGTLAGWLLLAGTGRGLDALTLGSGAATTLGIDLRRLRLRIFAATAEPTARAVAVTGSIGFVGLVVPHLLRPLVGFRPGPLLWTSALGGAILLLIADMAVRLFPAATEIKVGVVTAIVGAPFFLYLVARSRTQ